MNWFKFLTIRWFPSLRDKEEPESLQTTKDVINTYNPATDTLSIDTTLIANAFGFMDLYRDEGHDDPYHIQKLLSDLDRQAEVVIKKLEDARWSITLPRQDVNTLRKFLFMLSYRNGVRSRQFVEAKFDSMTRVEVETFRQAHHLKDFRAVWMLNIRNILLSEHWEVSTNRDILYSDRCLYKRQMQDMQLGIYKAPNDDQFILTEAGFGTFEGSIVPPLTMMGMRACPDADPRYTSFHHTHTYAITPNLVIVLRGTHLTMEQFHLDSGTTRNRARPQVLGHTLSESYFADFPRSLANVTYNPPLNPATIQDWFRSPKPKTLEDLLTPPMVGGRPIMSRLGDTLEFQIHPLTNSQAERVNSLIFESYLGTIIAFKTASSFLASIGAYERAHPFAESPFTTPRYSKFPFASIKRKLKEFIYPVGVKQNAPSILPFSSPAVSTSKDSSSPPTGSILKYSTTRSSASTTVPSQNSKREDFGFSLPGLRGAFSSSRQRKQK